MKRWLLLFVLLFSLSLLFASGSNKKSELTIAMESDGILNLNPYVTTDSTSILIMQNIYEGLFCYNEKTAEPQNAIASSYDISDDGLTWTFNLCDAHFSDNSKITAQTFVSSWNYLKQGPLASNLDEFTDFYAPDDSTLVIRLSGPIPYLPQILCQPCFAAIKDTSTYSGAYCLVSADKNQVKLKENSFYAGEVKSHRITVLLNDVNAKDFKNGKIIWSASPLENQTEFMIVSPLYGTNYFFFPLSGSLAKDEETRKSLVSAIPWDVISVIQDTLIPTTSLVPQSGVSAVFDKTVKAISLPKISIGIHRGSQTKQSAELIADFWSRVFGVTVTLDIVPVSVYMDYPQENPYDFCEVTWIGDYYDPMAFLSLFKGSSLEFDNLINQSLKADEKTREDLLVKAEKVLLDSCLVIPISNPIAVNFVRTDLIEGWYPNSLDIHPFRTIYQK